MDWLEEFLKNYKSAEVIDDPEKIAETLEGIIHKQRATVGSSLHTRLSKIDDGFRIEKQTGDKACKGAPEVPKGDALKRLFKTRRLEFEEGFDQRIIPYWASDERVDAHGDIVKANWIFDQFEKNSVLPFSHNWHDLPIGNSLMEQVVDRKDGKGKEKYEGKALWLLAFFASEEQSPFADSVFRLVKGGLLKSGSVGFWSEKLIEVKDEDERAKLGLGRWGVILDKNHLLEYSPVLLPANTGAFSLLSQAKQKELLVAGDFRVIRELYRQEIENENAEDCGKQWDELDANLKVMQKTLFAEAEWLDHKELDVPLISCDGEVIADTDESTTIQIRFPKTKEQDSEAIQRLEEKLDRLLSLNEQVLLSQGKVLEDIREAVEELTFNRELESVDDETQQDDPSEPQGDSSSVDELLRSIDEALEGANSV